MKYAALILGGGADAPVASLDERTPLEAAETPNLDRLAADGRLGRCAAVPPGLEPDVAISLPTLLGDDVWRSGFRRGPVEAAAAGLELGPADWAMRLDFASVEPEAARASGTGGPLVDARASGLTRGEREALLAAVVEAWRAESEWEGMSAALVGDGAVVIDRSGRSYEEAETWAPATIVGMPWRRRAPGGPAGGAGETLTRLMELSMDALLDHEVNVARREEGLGAVNIAWLWGAGRRIEAPPFRAAHDLSAAIITGSETAAGLARLLGIERVSAPGLTDDADTDFDAMGAYACSALERFDLVLVYSGAAGRCAERGEALEKVAVLERIDAEVAGPLLASLSAYGDAEEDPTGERQAGWRMLAACDTVVRTDERVATPEPTPVALAGGWVRSVLDLPFSEMGAAQSDLVVDPGRELMEYFLYSGLKRRGRSISPEPWTPDRGGAADGERETDRG